MVDLMVLIFSESDCHYQLTYSIIEISFVQLFNKAIQVIQYIQEGSGDTICTINIHRELTEPHCACVHVQIFVTTFTAHHHQIHE